MLVTVITPSNAAIFPEYIIPNIRHLVQDSEILVRSTYAQCIVQLADTAARYLEMGQALRAHGVFVSSPDTYDPENAHFEVGRKHFVMDLIPITQVTGIIRCEHARAPGSHPRTSVYSLG